MNLATRCPDCETVFRLTKEQSIARAGLVRCGACGHAFNALDYLEQASGMPVVDVIEEPAAPQTAVQQDMDTDLARDEASDQDATLHVKSGESGESMHAEDDGRATAAWERYRHVTQRDKPEGSDFLRPEPTFLKKARQLQRRRGTRTQRIIFAALGLLAFAALTGQAVHAWRHEIAAWQPMLKPWLQRACVALHCTVQLPAHIERISIISSELEALPDSANAYSLTLLLRNHSRLPQRHPALDLTLTGAQQQPLLRRVILPQEYLAAADPGILRARLAAGMLPDSELPVRITFTAATPPATDYKLAVFYP